MKRKWIVDILIDLRDYASENELYELANSLEGTRMMYVAELERMPGNDRHSSSEEPANLNTNIFS